MKTIEDLENFPFEKFRDVIESFKTGKAEPTIQIAAAREIGEKIFKNKFSIRVQQYYPLIGYLTIIIISILSNEVLWYHSLILSFLGIMLCIPAILTPYSGQIDPSQV